MGEIPLTRSLASAALLAHSPKILFATCSAGKDHSSGQAEPITMGLDDALEYIADDELVEVSHSLQCFK